jgi:3-deoxy-D-manno-octulosonate 8-phosphate phosphatase (KDO 8-P phosphatase)
MIKLLVLDVDGCLTDGAIGYTQSGDEIKTFNVKDGLAIASWIKMGKKVAIITGRKSEIVTRRAKELGVTHLCQGIKDKKSELSRILKEEHLDFDDVAAIGDDLNDYHLLQSVALSFTPRDGVAPIQKIVNTVLFHRGGEGAVREMIELILQRDGEMQRFLDTWV